MSIAVNGAALNNKSEGSKRCFSEIPTRPEPGPDGVDRDNDRDK